MLGQGTRDIFFYDLACVRRLPFSRLFSEALTPAAVAAPRAPVDVDLVAAALASLIG